MKLRCVRIIFIIFLIAWMGLIFFMSSREADTSSEMSAAVGMEIGHIFVPDFDEWSIEKQEAFAERIEYPVRKCAHACEYAVLGMLWLGVLLPGSRGRKESGAGQISAGQSGAGRSVAGRSDAGQLSAGQSGTGRAGTGESGAGRADIGRIGIGRIGIGRIGIGRADMGRSGMKRMRPCWYQAWLLASLYAATDEFHQLFVKGRSGQISDVLLDSAGAVAGILLIKLALMIVGRKK